MSATRQPQTLLSNAVAILHGRTQSYNIFFETCKNIFFRFLLPYPIFKGNSLFFPLLNTPKYPCLSQ